MATGQDNTKKPSFDAGAIQRGLIEVSAYATPYIEAGRKWVGAIFSKTPDWVQNIFGRAYTVITRHQLLSDYVISFAFWFTIPFLGFLIWSLGGLLITGFIGAVLFAVVNGFVIGSAAVVVTPFLIFAFIASFITTCIITLLRWCYCASEFFIKAKSSFPGNGDGNGNGGDTAGEFSANFPIGRNGNGNASF
ncbi:hypothetical protein G9A89_001827 [Geosiphon pyriformis]|nr:hypothetical protein G9A89_001827 [Geosiphon pyriformis]